MKLKDKIEAITTFLKKYPDISIVPKISESIVKRLYGEEVLKEYKEILDMYSYLRDRKSRGKLKEEDLLLLKNANVGGVFGYSDEVEELHEKYNVNSIDVAHIIKKYGSIENFYKEYKANNITNEESFLAEYFIKSIYAIDSEEENYNRLVKSVILMDKILESKFYVFSLNKIKDALFELRKNELEVLKLRFGLEDGKYRTLEKTGENLGVGIARVRQIETKGLMKLRFSNSDQGKFCWNLNDVIEKLNLEEKEVKKINKIDSIIRISNDEEKIKELKQLIKTYIDDYQNKFNKFPSINRLGLSTRALNGLKRNNIKTLRDLVELDVSDLMSIRNLGAKCVNEIISKINEYGYTVVGNRFELESMMEDNNENSNENKDVSIASLGFSSRTFNCLMRSGITTLEELVSYNIEDLKNIRNLGSNCLMEIINKVKKYGYIVVADKFISKEELKLQSLEAKQEKLASLYDRLNQAPEKEDLPNLYKLKYRK